MAELDGAIAIVTGAGGGIGAGIARSLAREGSTVVVNDVMADGAERTVAEIREHGGTASAHVCDVSDSRAATELVERAAAEHHRVDVLVNNAGILGRSPVAAMGDAEWHRVLAVNLHGCFYTSRAAVRVMREASYGRIVNVASIAGIRISLFGSAAYTASKAGLLGLTRHLAVEVAPFGITVNAVLPGATATALIEGADLDAVASAIPRQQAASPEDHAAVVAFLAGPRAGHITGAAIPVDGGVSVLPGDFTSYRAASQALDETGDDGQDRRRSHPRGHD
jgi:3-oxoacyl-[acyl-carrier protein] reductase